MNGLNRNACRVGDCSSFAKVLEDAVDDMHSAPYPINGYFAQAPYPFFFNAPTVPSWHSFRMQIDPSSAIDLHALRDRMKELGVTQKKLADEMGLNQSAVSNILNGTRGVKAHEAAFIMRRLNLGEMSLISLVPVIGMTSAGNWREAVDMPGRRVPVPPHVAGANAFALEPQGDSLDEILIEGAYIVIDPDQTQLYNEKVYLIENEEHETQVKVYRSDPARFEPRSSNDTHRTVFMGEERIRVIGRVVWQGIPL